MKESLMPTELNWDVIANALKIVIEQNLKDVLEGSAEDLERYAERMSEDLVAAAARQREDLLKSLANQAKMLAEVTRLRAVNESWDTVGQVITIVGQVAISLAIAGI
jgi:hypothetical protein